MPRHLINLNVIKKPDQSSPFVRDRAYRASIPQTEVRSNILFSNMETAKSYNAELSSFATLQIRNLNRLTTDCYAEYRRRALSLPATKRTECASAFQVVDKQVNLLLTNSGRADGYYHLIHHARVWVDQLFAVLAAIEELPVMKADTEARAAIKTNRHALNDVIRSLREYPLHLYAQYMSETGET